MTATADSPVAVWALTPSGAGMAATLSAAMPGVRIHVPESLDHDLPGARRFARLADAVAGCFNDVAGHVFIMSTGIVVRTIAPLIRHKTRDPAVVVVDDRGLHAISLLSGHIGGANALCAQVAGITGADPVITTATDVHGLPAIDVVAVEKHLTIDNVDAVRRVSMALLAGTPVGLWDPYRLVADDMAPAEVYALDSLDDDRLSTGPCIVVDDRSRALPDSVLVLRPPSLVAGMGCNRNTPVTEMRDFLQAVLDENGLAPASLTCIATIDIKADEPGLLALAKERGLPLALYSRDQLNAVGTVPNPSETVNQHVGVKSVCEAAAILGTGRGTLIVPKTHTHNVTVAVARASSMSWEPDPEASIIFPGGERKFSPGSTP